nr:MAG TPA: hypothetical protein [Caudoviricetes sp.]
MIDNKNKNFVYAQIKSCICFFYFPPPYNPPLYTSYILTEK